MGVSKIWNVYKAATKGKKVATPTFKAKKDLYIKQFQKSKKHSLGEKLNVWANRESGKLISEIGSGVKIKYTKKGKPYVPKGTKPSMLTKAKGGAKIVAPVVGAIAAQGAFKKKEKKK